MIGTLGFDADDTLWHNENIYAATHERFRKLLRPFHPDAWIDARLQAAEMRNLARFGYGIKGFTLSMIETAIELTEGRIPGSEIQGIIELGKEMLDHPVETLPGVRETLSLLAPRFECILITKGDLFDQETKLARSGLGSYFSRVEILSEKDEAAYRAILARHSIPPGRFLMVGNSVKSDILPVLALGARAVHIPYHLTWAHEQVAEEVLEGLDFPTLASMAELPAFLDRLG